MPFYWSALSHKLTSIKHVGMDAKCFWKLDKTWKTLTKPVGKCNLSQYWIAINVCSLYATKMLGVHNNSDDTMLQRFTWQRNFSLGFVIDYIGPIIGTTCHFYGCRVCCLLTYWTLVNAGVEIFKNFGAFWWKPNILMCLKFGYMSMTMEHEMIYKTIRIYCLHGVNYLDNKWHN